MSATKQITLWCDAASDDGPQAPEQCAAWVQVCQRSIAKARREARDQGWRHRGRRDYCPKHRRPLTPTRGGDRP